MVTITGCRARDIRFPTSRQADGSDAMNPDPDYSAAYVVLTTDQAGLEGHGLTFTLGRGNELCVAAIEALAPLVVGYSYGYFSHIDLIKIGAFLTIVEFIGLALSVAFYWPFLGL